MYFDLCNVGSNCVGVYVMDRHNTQFDEGCPVVPHFIPGNPWKYLVLRDLEGWLRDVPSIPLYSYTHKSLITLYLRNLAEPESSKIRRSHSYVPKVKMHGGHGVMVETPPMGHYMKQRAPSAIRCMDASRLALPLKNKAREYVQKVLTL